MKVHSNALLLQRHSQVTFGIQYNIHQLSYGPLCIENYISLIKSFDGYNICYLAYINFLRPLYTRSRRHEPYIIIWTVQITFMTASTINQYLLVHIIKIVIFFSLYYTNPLVYWLLSTSHYCCNSYTLCNAKVSKIIGKQCRDTKHCPSTEDLFLKVILDGKSQLNP